MTTTLQQPRDPGFPVQSQPYASIDLDMGVPPTLHAFNLTLPPWPRWSNLSTVDELLRDLGMGSFPTTDTTTSEWSGKVAQRWQAQSQTAAFATLCAPLLAALGWYGGQPGEAASPAISQALLGQAIVEHFLGATADFPEPLAGKLRGTWPCDFSHAQLTGCIRAAIHSRQPAASEAARELLFYLLVREALPELLVEGVPDHLPFGRSLQSVALSHGVALLAALPASDGRALGYDRLVTLSAELAQSCDPAIHALWVATLVQPALRYACAHGALDWASPVDLARASARQISQALAFLQRQQEQHAQELNDLLARRAPDRRQLAQHMLRGAAVPEWLWAQAIHVDHWPILQQHGFSIARSYTLDGLLAVGQPAATVLELVMMGEAYIAGQPTIPEAYASAFEAFAQGLVAAQARVILRLLGEMPPGLQAILLNATCELSRVNFAGEEGCQGLFLRCQQGDHRSDFAAHGVAEEMFIELIPASGAIRQVTQRFAYQVEPEDQLSGNIVETLEKQQRHAQRVALARVTPLRPMDSDAYLSGRASRSSQAWHQPRSGLLVPAAEYFYLGDRPRQAGLEGLAFAAARHLYAPFLQQTRARHEHTTGWEARWAKERECADLAARLIVPFYGCVRDLSQGEHSAGVIAGCVVDGLFALLPLGQFASATARVVRQAGELSVLSLNRLMGQAAERLLKGLAEQSAVFALGDLTRITARVVRLGRARLLQQLPALETLLGAGKAATLDRDVYEVVEDAAGGTSVAQVDGRSRIAVSDVGTSEAADWRLFDAQTQCAFGPPLTVVAREPALELASISAASGIQVGRYPPLVPFSPAVGGVRELRIAAECRVRVVEREHGVFEVGVDGEVYRLDTSAPDAALRTLASVPVAPAAEVLQEVEALCRVRRDLVELPCASGVRLATPEALPLQPGSVSPKRTGKYPSQAMAAREFSLARLSVGQGEASRQLDVFVHEGKFCQWAGKQVVVLSDTERALLALPEAPLYHAVVEGRMAMDTRLGLPHNYPQEDATFIYEHAPVVELGPIALGVDDARRLRGIRRDISGQPWVFIEPDDGVFYKAAVPLQSPATLSLLRVSDEQEINEFIRLSEQYRLLRERPGAVQDQQNIARLLFDLLDAGERQAWSVQWSAQINDYQQYVQWCLSQRQPNELLGYAANILAGESMQKAFVELARRSIPDFVNITERSLPERQHLVEVLNRLLPVQGSTARWAALTVDTVHSPEVVRSILKQIKGANLSFVQVHTQAGQRIVYYALSGGARARSLRLRLDIDGSSEQLLDGVLFRDARARMAGRAADPGFTSLPVLRDADRLAVREFDRQLDSERLIATVLKEDLADTALTHIKVFTLLDTCRSCGGFVLPRLKLDFPEAAFSVTYLKHYGLS